MNRKPMASALALALCGAGLYAAVLAHPQTAQAEKPAAAGGITAIVGAMVFDGTGAAPTLATVLVKDGRILAVGKDVKVPAGATIINARGKALTPGFYDLHTHWTPSGDPGSIPQIATDYVKAGVTTVDDFNEQPEAFEPIRTWLSEMASPHVNFAARISTPGGHGADWADQATTNGSTRPRPPAPPSTGWSPITPTSSRCSPMAGGMAPRPTTPAWMAGPSRR